MPRLALLLLLILCSPLVGAAGASFGMHGMALFGDRGALYASHLPMFHAPHDYQVILKVRLADRALDAALRARFEARPSLWTLAPEKFDLDRLQPGSSAPLTGFTGGSVRHIAAAIVVEQVLVFRQLSAQAVDRRRARYLQLGSGSRRFLVKEIDSRPDFDHIVAIRAPAGAPGAPLAVAKDGMRQPPAALLARALPGSTVRATVYFDTGDLK
jgi:hypothetical protein